MPSDAQRQPLDPPALLADIRRWATDFGFSEIGVAGTDLREPGERLRQWLAAGYHGDMRFMTRHGEKRSQPALLVPGTVRVISARMDCMPRDAAAATEVLSDPTQAYVARYALGRDYHKHLRRQLARLAVRIGTAIGPYGYRVYTDSGPVMEKPLARAAGLGWQGKHTNIISRSAGSWFLLGEILTDLPLPVDAPVADHCGTCRACMDVCPTGAIVAPYVVDARRCISYLTIENPGPIPEALRPLVGNRIFGCDDCQLFCPWNKFARPTTEAWFAPRQGLDRADLVELFAWSEAEWEERTAGSALRRAGYGGWLRNLAVALGNAPPSPRIAAALSARRDHADPLVREHVRWALGRQARAAARPSDAG